jgi:hypothetical protein
VFVLDGAILARRDTGAARVADSRKLSQAALRDAPASRLLPGIR